MHGSNGGGIKSENRTEKAPRMWEKEKRFHPDRGKKGKWGESLFEKGGFIRPLKITSL